MNEEQAWELIASLTVEEKRELLAMLDRLGKRPSTSDRQVPPANTPEEVGA